MECRTVTEVRLYVLVLNTFGAAETGDMVAISDDYDKLVNWYNDQFAEEPYRDGEWFKTFKPGSTIEWYNPCSTLELNNNYPFGHGIHDEWVTEDLFERIKSSHPRYI